jgi:hypothetical protein
MFRRIGALHVTQGVLTDHLSSCVIRLASVIGEDDPENGFLLDLPNAKRSLKWQTPISPR